MSDVLIDTSAWIAALRGDDPMIQKTLDHLLETDKALFCGVVEMELLHGMRPKEKNELLPLFQALPFIDMDREDWRSAGNLLRNMRSKGKNIPATDAIIAVLCIRHNVCLLSLDKHFEGIPKLNRLPTAKKNRK